VNAPPESKVRFQQFAWQCRAIHVHERLVSPLRAQWIIRATTSSPRRLAGREKQARLPVRLQIAGEIRNHLGLRQKLSLRSPVAYRQRLILRGQLLLLPATQHRRV